MNWPFRRRGRFTSEERLADLEERFAFFQNLEQQFRVELEAARREEERARAREDEVNREMFRRRIDLLASYLAAIARVKFVIDQVRYALRFQEGMGQYGELRRTLADAGVSGELKRAFDAIHQDLEIIRRSSTTSMEKINGYLESLSAAAPSSATPLRAAAGNAPEARPAPPRPAVASTPEPTQDERARATEERIRRRLEEP